MANVYIVADGNHLPFKGDSFYLIISHALLEHVRKPDQEAREMNSVLRSGS